MNKSGKRETIKNNTDEISTFAVPFFLEELEKNFSKNINISLEDSNEKIIKQALRFHSQGNIEEAAKSYQLLVDNGIKDHKIFSNYGCILKELGQLEEAERFERKAIEIQPNFAQAYYNLGIILKDIGKSKEAEISTRKAIKLQPDLPNAHLNLGTILGDFGEFKEAEMCYLKAIEIKPNFVKAYYNLGNLYYKQGNFRKASDCFYQSLALDPDNNQIRYNLGFALENEANSHFNKAFEETGVSSKLSIVNKKLKKFTKKKIIIDQDIIIYLDKISQTINALYGLTSKGQPAINSGPCGVFANEFFLLWNSRFINQVEIVVVMDLHPYQSNHVLIRLPNNELFDGGKGVHSSYFYKRKGIELIIMEKYDLKMLDKYSWGLIRSYKESCPDFSISKISQIIAQYLDKIYYDLN